MSRDPNMNLYQIRTKARRAPLSGDAAIYDKKRRNAAILWRYSNWPRTDAESEAALQSAVGRLREWAKNGIQLTFA